MLKEFLDVCARLGEAELKKLLKKKIAHANKEHNDFDRKSTRTISWNSRGSGRFGLLKMPKGAQKDVA